MPLYGRDLATNFTVRSLADCLRLGIALDLLSGTSRRQSREALAVNSRLTQAISLYSHLKQFSVAALLLRAFWRGLSPGQEISDMPLSMDREVVHNLNG